MTDEVETVKAGLLPSLNKGLTRESLRSFVEAREEPGWVLERRRRGWSQFEELGPPLWRRTDLSSLDLGELAPNLPRQSAVTELDALPPKLSGAVAAYGQRAGLLLQRDAATVYVELSEEARRLGVIWTDLETAVREYPELVSRHLLAEGEGAALDRFHALHSAFWSGGTFLYLPEGAKVELPLVSVVWLEMPQAAVFPPTLAVAEAGSSATLVSELLSMGCDACPPTLHGGSTELHVGSGARMRFVNAQDLGKQVYDLRTQTARLGRDSHLEWLTIALGGRVSRSTQHTVLQEPGAEAIVTGLYLTEGRQQIAFDTLQDHVAGGCSSDLLYQGALMGASRAVYEGTIRAWPGAQKTNAYQSNRNLLLSKKARADSLPKLEIEANDLRCTHGATVSQVDDDQVFYLMSRGIPRLEAVGLIVEGFFRPAFDRMPESLAGLRDRLLDAIAAKLRG